MKTCPCGKQIPKKIRVSWRVYNKKKYCSNPCKFKYGSMQPVEQTCIICRKTFSSKRIGYCCGNTCASALRSYNVIMRNKSMANLQLSDFTGRTKEIIEYRFGLNGKSYTTLKDIGSIYGLSRERVRQIIKQAVT